jgi:ATP-dependent DNA ligase
MKPSCRRWLEEIAPLRSRQQGSSAFSRLHCSHDADARRRAAGGEGRIHEIKHDGYRTMLAVDGSASRAFTRNGHDWTKQYRTIVASAASD